MSGTGSVRLGIDPISIDPISIVEYDAGVVVISDG